MLLSIADHVSCLTRNVVALSNMSYVDGQQGRFTRFFNIFRSSILVYQKLVIFRPLHDI
jgi:hypothetical protein